MLITGAAGGIGRATVAHFAEKGWRVIGVDRADFREGFPDNGLFIRSDISLPEEMHAIFEKTHAFTENLDALVNNAALQIAKPLIDTSVEEWDAVMASNLRSVFLGVKLAHPDRTVVGLSGDGGSMYTFQALWTAAHEHIATKFVVCNNHSYRLLKQNLLDYWRDRGLDPGDFPASPPTAR